ncbi:hypothetical protein BHM03_00016870 [Ensete ventricosum]|nr:hypothetical protein BHM03_00016870 [Ensete ventricosum]
MRPSFSCTTTVASALTSSGTFPTPSAADNGFTCSPTSTDRPSRSSISSAEVNRHQTFTAVDNTMVSLTSGQDLRPSQELDLARA